MTGASAGAPEPETYAEGLTAGQLAPGQEPYVDPDPPLHFVSRYSDHRAPHL